MSEVGYVISSRDFLVNLDGFPTVKINDLVQAESGARGWINTLAEDSIEVLMLDEQTVSPNESFKRLDQSLGISVGEFLLGRSINPLGIPIDGKGPLRAGKDAKASPLDLVAPGIEAREFITEQFLTGVTLIDTLLPLGKGQRELVLGDAHSGKTQFLIDTIVNQKGTNTICIYASIGKPAGSVRNLIDTLKANGSLDYTVVIATSSSAPVPLIFLTPKTALTVAEYFQKQGRDVLLILDDMGIHAKIHREISLLSNKPPGRESYPGDTFYQHARLLERAGRFNKLAGGGSITTLPVVELNLSDFTTLIPTNLMAITDGHLLFKSDMYSRGQRPAVDISLSVTRVGRQTQDHLSNMLSSRVRSLLSQASDLETISRFSSELPLETQRTLRRRDQIMELLKQDPFTAIPKQIQVIMLCLPFTSFFDDKNRLFIDRNKQLLMNAFLKNPNLLAITKAVPKLKSDDELIKLLEGAVPTLTRIIQ